jgi:hypothetical protein
MFHLQFIDTRVASFSDFLNQACSGIAVLTPCERWSDNNKTDENSHESNISPDPTLVALTPRLGPIPASKYLSHRVTTCQTIN